MSNGYSQMKVPPDHPYYQEYLNGLIAEEEENFIIKTHTWEKINRDFTPLRSQLAEPKFPFGFFKKRESVD